VSLKFVQNFQSAWKKLPRPGIHKHPEQNSTAQSEAAHLLMGGVGLSFCCCFGHGAFWPRRASQPRQVGSKIRLKTRLLQPNALPCYLTFVMEPLSPQDPVFVSWQTRQVEPRPNFTQNVLRACGSFPSRIGLGRMKDTLSRWLGPPPAHGHRLRAPSRWMTGLGF